MHLLLKETYDQLKPFTAKTGDLIIDSEFTGGQNNWSISTDIKTSLGTLSPNARVEADRYYSALGVFSCFGC